MDRKRCFRYIFIVCYLFISWADGKSLYINQRHLLQDTSDHDEGQLTDLSDTSNGRTTGSRAIPGQDYIAAGPDQTDQSLHSQSGDIAAHGDLDTVHSSDGHLVAQLQNGDLGGHDTGHDLDTAGQSQGHDDMLGDLNEDSPSSHDSGHIQSAIDDDHSLQNGQIVDSSQGVLNPLGSAQDTDHAIINENQQSGVDHNSDIVSGLFDDTVQTDNDDDDVIYDDSDDYVLPDGHVNIHQDVSNGGSDSALPAHTDHDGSLPVGHDNLLPDNDGMILDSHSSSNASAIVVAQPGGDKDIGAPIVNGDSHHPVHSDLPSPSDHHSEGSGSSPPGQHNNTADHLSGHGSEHNTGLLLDSEFGNLNGHESLDGHIEHPPGHGHVIAHPDSGVVPTAVGPTPDTDHIHAEGSGSSPDTGTEQGHEPGSGQHGLIPSHNLPPSHGHEVNPDTIAASGDGPVIDKDGGIHDLSHHENQEPEHGQTQSPRHTASYTTSTTPSASTTQVKVMTLPSLQEPEPTGHSRTTLQSHGGDKIEGSGGDGHLGAIATSPTTPPGEGHEVQGHGQEGHIVAVTTTPSSHHEFEGSGSGAGHEGHTDEHEGDGHLPGEGSGQDPEGHEGLGNTTIDKAGKEHNKEEGPKDSTSIAPSEAPYQLQPSVSSIIPTSSSFTQELMTEAFTDHSYGNSLHVTEAPISVRQNSQSSEVLSSYSTSSIFSSFSTPELSFATKALNPQDITQTFLSSRTATGSSVGTDTSMTQPLPTYSSSIQTSIVVLENTSQFSSMSTRNSEELEVMMSTKHSTPSASSCSSQSLSEASCYTQTVQPALEKSDTVAVTSPIAISPSVSIGSSAEPVDTSSTINTVADRPSVSFSVSPSSLTVTGQSSVTISISEAVSPSSTQTSVTPVLIRPTSSTTHGHSVVIEHSPLTTSPSSSSSTTSNISPSNENITTTARTILSSLFHSQAPRTVFSRNGTLFASTRSLATNVKTILTPVIPGRGNMTTTSNILVSSVPTRTTASRQNASVNQPSSPGAQPSTQKSTLSPLVTTLLSTTKRKNISFIVTALTTPSTTKKPSSPTTKGPDKPETNTPTSTTRVLSTNNTRYTGTSRPSLTERTTLSPIHEIRPSSSTASPTSPPVFVQIELRMTWSEFCSKKMYFIADLREIIHTEKRVLVAEERFIISNLHPESCRMAERNLMTSQIKIHVYIMNEEGGVDISLTVDLSNVIEKGFKTLSSEFKDKFVRAQLFPPPQATSAPRPNSPLREVQTSPGITMVTIIASVGGACCVILIFLQIMIRRRILQKKARAYVWGQRASLQSLDHVALGVIPKSRPNSGYWNPALEQEEIPEPSPQSHLVNFAGLANFSLDKNGIYEEFQMIPFETPEKSEVPIGVEEKNRFANVLPFKATRVRLDKKEGADNSEYINANYIKGYKKTEKAYVATQSPMINTAEDFWRMVWEQQSRVILMLNPLNDTGKPKMCTMYWPDGEGSECVKQFGDYAVTLKKKDIQHDYIETTLQLRDMERNLRRDIHHFWFTTWPETGLPEPLAFVKFILDARPRYEDTGTPLVVHCGPGTGRTGVLIAVDVCMRMFEEKRRVDVLQCVHQMRKERAGTVQSRDQYALIYQALNEYAVILSSPSMSTRSSVITLHAML